MTKAAPPTSAAMVATREEVFYAVMVAGPALAGWLTGSRARQVEELRRRNSDLELRRETALQAARADEAERVERQVDVALAERLRTIIDDARTAGRLSAQSPGEVPLRLAGVEATARDALADLREVLGVLQPVTSSAPAAPSVAVSPPRATGWDLVDLALALSLVPLAVETSVSGTRVPIWLDVLACAAQGALLLVVRRRPLVGATALLTLACVQSAFVTPLPPTVSWLLPALLVAFLVGARLPRTRAIAGLALVGAGISAVTVVTPAASRSTDGLLPGLALGLLAWWAGRTVAVRERRAAELVALAEELARTRDEQVRVAAAEQRAEMARELHDVGAHALTVVCLQAGAAQTMWTRDRAQACSALRVVLDLADDSLTHLRESLGALAGESSAIPLDVAALDVLAGMGRVLGLRVGVSVHGEPRPLPGEVARAAFRVVQESLTNAAR
ncbi:MAG: sensor histidine kinase [Marmoricola sp.]